MKTSTEIKKMMNDCIKWIKETFEANGKDCVAVVGISGGIDSSVVAALCVKALGKDRVFGVLMPNGEQPDIDSALKLVKYLNIKFMVIDIYESYKDILDSLYMEGYYNPDKSAYDDFNDDFGVSNQTKINLAPRLRMSVLYAVSQSINGRVMNTSNLSERYIGYSTRYGDSVGDFSPLYNITKTEVIKFAEELGLPDELAHKIPSDGLSGKTDEDNFGFTYDVLDDYILTKNIEDYNIKQKIDSMHEKNKFKTLPMPTFNPYAI